MQGIERATQYGYSIYEFEVYGKALKEDLRILYDAVKDTDEALYTPKSFEAFKKALDTAKAVLEKEEVTEQEVKEAYDALTSANEQLQYKADKTYLKTQLDKAHTLKESEYTPNSYAQFKKVLSNAQKVYDNENATQEEVQEVEKTLKDAIEKLVLKANKTELGELIKKAKGLNSKDYTPETFKTLNEALIEAQKTYDNEKATQEDVQKSYVQLKDAYDGLKKVEVNESGNPAIPSNPNDSNKPLKPSDFIQTDSENRNVNGDTVDTSDSSIIIPGIIAIAISGLVILKLKRNKKAFLKNKV